MAMTSESPLDLVLANFEIAWRSGSQPRAEAWVGHLDSSRPSEVTELIYHEYCLAESDGLSPQPNDYLSRFPDHRESLIRLFELHSLTLGDLTGHWQPPVPLPKVGDTIGPYHLCRLLGEGSFAAVFLAEETDLGGRFVVVKVTTRPSPEPRLLARARHTHIVEVLRHGKTPDGAFQLIFMPFLGGATLHAVASETFRLGSRPRSGRDLLTRLDRVSAREYPSADVTRPAREILGRLTYPKAIAYIFARLSEALDHAYRRGVAHGDVKPSNILLTADGLPMLFDFNLAIDCLDAETTLGGGTLAYMPPERLRAIDPQRNEVTYGPTPTLDLHRADLYALGLVLIETLTGVAPYVPQGSPGQIADARAGGVTVFSDWPRLPIPASLRPILTRCLAANPADRYPDGRALASDLDRWRSDLVPLGVPDRSVSVRMSRWVSRHRMITASGALTFIVAIASGVAISKSYQSTIRDRAQERYAQVLDKNDLGFFGFRPFGAWARLPTDDVEVTKRKLNAYNVLNDPNWRDRDDVQTLTEPHRADLELLMLEQVYRLASAYSKRTNSNDDWKRAIELLDRECRHISATPLETLRNVLRKQLGVVGPSTSSIVATAPIWLEEYLLGVASEPTHEQAFLHYEKSIHERADLLWPRYRGSIAACATGHYPDAVTYLKIATQMRPDNPSLHTALATSLFKNHQLEAAKLECDQAVSIDPDFATAYLSRAYVERSSDRPDLSRIDVERFNQIMQASVRESAARTRIDFFNFNRLMGAKTQNNDVDVTEMIRKLRVTNPADPEARVQAAHQFGLDGRDSEAITLLEQLLQEYPEHLRARYNLAYFYRKNHNPKAMDESEYLVNDPRFVELLREAPDAIRVYHFLTEDLLNQQRNEEARKIAAKGLAESLRTNLHVAEAYYAYARALAAIAGTRHDQLDVVKSRLQQAVDREGILRNWYWNDIYFKNLRMADPEFLKSSMIPSSSKLPDESMPPKRAVILEIYRDGTTSTIVPS